LAREADLLAHLGGVTNDIEPCDAGRRLDDAGIAIDDISVSTPTLDDVFLNLTGHAAEPETAEAEVQSR